MALSGFTVNKKVHCHHAMNTVVVTVAGRFVQCAPTCLTDVAKSVTWIRALIHLGVDPLVQMVVRVDRVTLNGRSNVSRPKRVAPRSFLL